MTGTTAIVDDPRFDRHRHRRYHPERPERLGAARAGLDAGLPQAARWPIDPRWATEEELVRVHPREHLDALERELARGWGQLDPDTYFCPDSREAAWVASGTTVQLVRALLADRASTGVALLRPPGHHARPRQAMGFCLVNHMAVAAADARAQGARVAIVDWDVHHGNGTQDALCEMPGVLFVSLHEWPFYPGTGRPEEIGRGPAEGRFVNVALPAGSGPPIYGEAFRRLVVPLLDAHGADLVLVSMGFDGHADDPLAGMELDDATYGAMATAVLDQARRAGHGRVAFLLEGGYDLGAIERSMARVARAIRGEETELPAGTPAAAQRRALEQTLHQIGPYWSELR